MGTSGRPVPGGSPEPSQPTGLGPSPAYGYWISYSRIPPGGSSLRSPVWVVEELCPIRGLCGLSAAVWSWSPVGSTMPNTRRPPGPAVRQFPQRVWGGPGGGGVLHPLPFVLQDPNPFPQALRHKAPLATRTPRCTWALSTPGPVLRAPSHPDLPSRPLHFQQGVPEDLLFFYNHLRKGGGVIRVDQSLLLYRYHPHAATHAVLEYEKPKPRVPILHFRAARPPFVICVKLDLTGGAFEDNLKSLGLQEGRDFIHFS
nr:UDP-GlcNAc:betaGal beta-1,3-N-acetylglucosaminyltransferase-like protein 1 isoform X15 [Manis javanica]